jgi:hypothetical protein
MFRDEGEGRAIGRKWTSEKGMNRLTAYCHMGLSVHRKFICGVRVPILDIIILSCILKREN